MSSYLMCFWKISKKGTDTVCPVSQVYEMHGRLPDNVAELIAAIMEVRAETIEIPHGLMDYSDNVRTRCHLKNRECCMCLVTTKNKAAIISDLANNNGLALMKLIQPKQETYRVLSEYKSSTEATVDSSVYFISAQQAKTS